MEITFRYWEDCPSHEKGLERLKQVLAEEGIDASITIEHVGTDEEARRLKFIGSPTFIVNGEDIDPPPDDAYCALTCRSYRLDDGRISPLPTADMMRRALRRAAASERA